MLFCAQNLRKDLKMRKVKIASFIFLIFTFVIIAIPAHAAESKKITSINIQIIYKVREGKITSDQVTFKPGRSEYSITIRNCMTPEIYLLVLIWTTKLL